MFDIFAKLLSSVATFLFPVFASYKALKTSDPALLTPWLMYWVVLACALLVESWTEFILVWVPFYSWLRAFFLLWLIAPQTQGAKYLYQTHVHPFLHEHELTIDEFISSAHDRAKEAGLKYLKQAIEFVKQNLLGLPPQQPAPPPPPTNLSYAQSLIARFNLPSTRPAFPASGFGSAATSTATSTATDFYTLLASAVSVATSSSSSATPSQNRDLSNSGTLIPPSISGEERITFIAAQRERLSILLSALDREARTLQSEPKMSPRNIPNMLLDGSEDAAGETSTNQRPANTMSGLSLSKSRSETDFEKIESDVEGAEEYVRRPKVTERQSSGSWLPWSWGGGKPSVGDKSAGTVIDETDEGGKGKSSGVEL